MYVYMYTYICIYIYISLYVYLHIYACIHQIGGVVVEGDRAQGEHIFAIRIINICLCLYIYGGDRAGARVVVAQCELAPCI